MSFQDPLPQELVHSVKDERLMKQQDFAKPGSLPGSGMRTTRKSRHGFGTWPIITDALYLN